MWGGGGDVTSLNLNIYLRLCVCILFFIKKLCLSALVGGVPAM